MFKFIKKLLFTILFISVFITMPKQVLANIPNFIGHVYYANQDGSKTNRGIPNIYIQWSDDRGHHRFAKTDQNGKFNFIEFARVRELVGMSPEDYVRKEHRTWIKPEEPEVPEVHNQSNPDQDLSSQGYVRKFSADLYETALTCSTNPQTFTIIQLKAWLGGDVVDAETDWYTEIAGTGYRSRVIRPGVVGDVVLNNGNNHPGQKFIANFWYKPPPSVGGQVKNNDNQPIPGVTINIYKSNGETKTVPTDTEGNFQLIGFINRGDIYAVRIDGVPPGYKTPPQTTTDGWTKRQGAPAIEPNTPLGSPSYEVQKYGDDDCAGPAGLDTTKIGRCNFKVDATFSAPPVSSQPVTQCRDIPVNNVLFGDIPLPLTGNNPISINLPPSGQSTYIIPVAINLDNTCSYVTLNFKYISTVTPPSSPDPILCAKPTGRPDSCACTLDNQCQGQKCDQNRQVCFTEAFIRTEGGDVHSNVKIEQ